MSRSKAFKRAALAACAGVLLAAAGSTPAYARDVARSYPTLHPIKHVVVIFQENVSFDHYFATYPRAANEDPREPRFVARPGTPRVNGLNGWLLNHNPNLANPRRLSRREALTCDQDHGYSAEQRAADRGLMDGFPQNTNNSNCAPPLYSAPNLVMDYYDGNTVTALWNYAQHFAMSDDSFGTTFGPSTPGALNLVSGQTHGAISSAPAHDTYGVVSPDPVTHVGTVINDPDPTYDDCSTRWHPTVSMVAGDKNVGDLLDAKGITWGWFEGGFKPTAMVAGKAVCGSRHANIGGVMVRDYVPHHEPFQYYAATANPHHLPPTSVAMIGRTDRANHQYDLSDFWAAVGAGVMPAVSFLKAAAYQDGHAGYSDPLDGQAFIVRTINRLEKSDAWDATAVIIAYDDSDGWYDHVLGPIVNPSADAGHDALAGAGLCGRPARGAYADRCGYGPRLPLLAISPWAKHNYVDHAVTDQSSILRFIEDNWRLGRIGDQSFDERAGTLDGMFDFHQRHARGRLFLDPGSGEVVSRAGGGNP